ncbi:MAG: hypothetical protein A7315_00150 [Candidatus Altiarchaeales archaeon WOR_SM1_79]|nr:MAG: hypothetical protein A7315_00150 [Candidatus Altiarchaeales archaeon WOR_SM1_79]
MAEKQTKRHIKKHGSRDVKYGTSAFDGHRHSEIPAEGARKLQKTTKIILICAAIILIIIITYIGLNYFYGYELLPPGETTFTQL